MSHPKVDFHIHTKYLGCANQTMEVPAIIETCERLGLTALGITDHLNTIDQLPKHIPILDDIRALDTDIDIYFGVELNYTGLDEDFVYSEEIKDKAGFQYAIGGIHSTYSDEWDVKKIVDIQHRHHIKTCKNPLVSSLVHPYWFSKNEFARKDWELFPSLAMVPENFVRELGQAARDTNTAIEINGDASLNPTRFSAEYIESYFDFLTILAEEGATFLYGSDAHDISYLQFVQQSWNMSERLNLTEDRIFAPDCDPINKK